VNVDPGDSIVLTALGLPDLGLFGPDLNAHLETPALADLGFTGVNPWDRTKTAKLAAGTWRYQYKDVTTATGIAAAKLEGVRSWIDAPTTACPAGRQHPPRRLRRHRPGRGRPRLLGRGPADGRYLKGHDQADHCVPGPRPGPRVTSFNRCQEHPIPPFWWRLRPS
jgi:hypothetical protein